MESVIVKLLMIKKKKYCYLKDSGEMVVKGMEMIRKD
jgi:DNA polymerase elongation subunit (family B)